MNKQKGTDGAAVSYAVLASYLGWVLVAATENGVCHISFGDDPEDVDARFRSVHPMAKRDPRNSAFGALSEKVLQFLEVPHTDITFGLDMKGTAFQLEVWAALQAISPGTTVSYSEIARRIGRPMAVRAVAGACAANPVAVAVPCHRVVRSDGHLGGYRWGIGRKRELLERESRGMQGALNEMGRTAGH